MSEPLTGAALLRGGDVRGRARERLVRSLKTPWGWPWEPTLQERARSIVPDPPLAPLPGEVLLVSVGCSTGLWRCTLAAAAAPAPSRTLQGTAMLSGDARAALELASRIVVRELPLLPVAARSPVGFREEGPPPVRLALVALLRDEEAPVQLDGPSYGLALLLAAVSWHIGQPVPADLCALGTIDAAGMVGGVGELRDKLLGLAGWGLGIRRLLVAPDQVAAVQDLLATEPAFREAGLEVVPVRSAAVAIGIAFPDLAERLAESLAAPQDQRDAAQRLFAGLVLDQGSLLLAPKAVLETCDLLQRLLGSAAAEADGSSLKLIEITRAVNLRHLGFPALIPWPDPEWLHSWRRPLRLRILAHLVQSAADCDEQAELDYFERARGQLSAPGEESLEELILLGALGRALAAVRQYPDAAALLRRAVVGFVELGQPYQASHSFCELCRVQGILGSEDPLTASWMQGIATDPRSPAGQLSFLRLARGRSLLQLGRPELAAEQLDPRAIEHQWRLCPLHVQQSRGRWWALTLDRLGLPAEAERERESLSADTEFRLLAALDRCLRDEEDPGSILEELQQNQDVGYEIRRLRRLASAGTLEEQAWVVVAEYRY